MALALVPPMFIAAAPPVSIPIVFAPPELIVIAPVPVKDGAVTELLVFMPTEAVLTAEDPVFTYTKGVEL